MGSRYLDERVAAQLVELDVEVDLTVEPGQIHRADGTEVRLRGTLPDYRRSPRRVHEVVPGLVELPLTAGSKVLGRDLHAHLSRMRRHGVFERLDQPLPFGMAPNGPLPFGEQVRRSLARQRRPYLAFAIRSGGILDPVVGPRLRSHLDQVLALPEADRFRFTTPQEAVAALSR